MTLGPSQPPTPSCRGGARHFHLGGRLEGPVLQQGELSMVYVGLSERDLKNFGGPGKILGGQCPPGTPLAAPLCANNWGCLSDVWRFCKNDSDSNLATLIVTRVG